MTFELWLIFIVPLVIISLSTYAFARVLAKRGSDYVGFTVIGGTGLKIAMFLAILVLISNKIKLSNTEVLLMLAVYFVLNIVLVIMVLPLLKTINVKKPSK